jgi:hypothetical protein
LITLTNNKKKATNLVDLAGPAIVFVNGGSIEKGNSIRFNIDCITSVS